MSNIINNFNDILNKFSFSLKKDGYKILDNISEIDINIFNREPIKTLCLDKNISVFILILNTLISAIILYYFFKCVLSLYSDTNISNIYYFVIKVILVAILSFNSIYICKEVININSLFSKTMGIFLEEVCENEINFDFLDDNISTLDGVFETTDKVGLNGLKDMVVCTYIISLIIFLSIRYVIILLCIILSPFAFICILKLFHRQNLRFSEPRRLIKR